jgi:hypothetical protein
MWTVPVSRLGLPETVTCIAGMPRPILRSMRYAFAGVSGGVFAPAVYHGPAAPAQYDCARMRFNDYSVYPLATVGFVEVTADLEAATIRSSETIPVIGNKSNESPTLGM